MLANLLAPMMQQQQSSKSPVKLELLKNVGAGQASLNPLSPSQPSVPTTQQLALPAANTSPSQPSVHATQQLALPSAGGTLHSELSLSGLPRAPGTLPNEAPAGPAAAALPSLASLPAAQAVALTGLASAQASAVQLPVQTGLAKGGEEAGMNSSAGEKRKSLEEFEQEAFEKLEKKADKKRIRKTEEKQGVMKRPCAAPAQLKKKNASVGTSSEPLLVCLSNNNLSCLLYSVAATCLFIQ